jgi:hypothetical protein
LWLSNGRSIPTISGESSAVRKGLGAEPGMLRWALAVLGPSGPRGRGALVGVCWRKHSSAFLGKGKSIFKSIGVVKIMTSKSALELTN